MFCPFCGTFFPDDLYKIGDGLEHTCPECHSPFSDKLLTFLKFVVSYRKTVNGEEKTFDFHTGKCITASDSIVKESPDQNDNACSRYHKNRAKNHRDNEFDEDEDEFDELEYEDNLFRRRITFFNDDCYSDDDYRGPDVWDGYRL